MSPRPSARATIICDLRHSLLLLPRCIIYYFFIPRLESSPKHSRFAAGKLQVIVTSYRRVGARTFYLRSARKNALSRLNIHARSARDGTFLRAEPRWDVLTRRGEMGRSYAPSGDRTFLRPPNDILKTRDCNMQLPGSKTCMFWRTFGRSMMKKLLSCVGKVDSNCPRDKLLYTTS